MKTSHVTINFREGLGRVSASREIRRIWSPCASKQRSKGLSHTRERAYVFIQLKVVVMMVGICVNVSQQNRSLATGLTNDLCEWAGSFFSN